MRRCRGSGGVLAAVDPWQNVISTGVRPWLQEPAADLDSLARELHLEADYLRRIQRLLEHKQQVIFYGPPGTGKTYVAKRLAQLFAATGGVVETVQFHPSYAYEDFVEGYRPRLTNGQAGFALVYGPLRRIADAAAKASGTCVLLMDEINRERREAVRRTVYLLEYRNERTSNASLGTEP